MQTRTVVLGSLLACGLAYGGILASQLGMPARAGFAEAQSDGGRGAASAKFQPQDGRVMEQVRHTRDNPISQGTAEQRAACPRCRISD